jgi:hypothetical protein
MDIRTFIHDLQELPSGGWTLRTKLTNNTCPGCRLLSSVNVVRSQIINHMTREHDFLCWYPTYQIGSNVIALSCTNCGQELTAKLTAVGADYIELYFPQAELPACRLRDEHGRTIGFTPPSIETTGTT